MAFPSASQAIPQLFEQLVRLLHFERDPDPQQAHYALSAVSGGALLDGLITLGPTRLGVVWRARSDTASVASALKQLSPLAQKESDVVPLLAVPYMTETGASRCEAAGASWIDLSGNVHLWAPGLRLVVQGKPNAFKRAGRKSTPFAPKSARLTRWLLMHPDAHVTQRELTERTGVSEGLTSRVVRRLIAMELVERDEDGLLRVPDRALLLDAWREAYRFEGHHLIQGHISARDGHALVEAMGSVLARADLKHAFTGLAAAWQQSHFAGFRLATVYLAALPPSALLEALRFRETTRGANTWLVIPNDADVFSGARPWSGVRCVHPVQTYLDLKGHPERALEAADELRQRWLTGELP